MPTLTLLRGLPASGKSTIARGYCHASAAPTIRLNRDDIRRSMFDGEGILAWKDEELISHFQKAQAVVALKAGRNVIVDDMNLRKKYVREWNEFAIQRGAEFATQDVNTPVDVCVARDSARERQVGERVIRDIAKRFLVDGKIPPYDPIRAIPFAPYIQNPELPERVIVDIDGTVALMGSRSPYDWKAVSQDKPNKVVVDLVKDLMYLGDEILFVSGRDGSCRMETRQWLEQQFGKSMKRWTLHMREAGDTRKDDIVKREIFDRDIAGKYYVKFVLDDRNQVVRMWRSLGLPTFQVADGDF